MDEQTSQKGIEMKEQQTQVDTSAAFQVVNEGFQQSICLQQERPEYPDLQQGRLSERLRYPAHRLQQGCRTPADSLQKCQYRPDEQQ